MDKVITLSDKGQVVIPAEIRQKYDLQKGDRFLVKDENGRITLTRLERHPLLGLRGAYKGQVDLTSELLKERRAEREREESKE
ncbi:MAG TPA: AbrB/MazE/SpoVT family DNA-binding domain-containing protein [Firmicutes bacterium]|nr:AbrB/MazE/SpoVT family DNA-binding domain-containing protein [Candidatus Fermentithermobacillaceae bacterium]